jgi:hypothetical protein
MSAQEDATWKVPPIRCGVEIKEKVLNVVNRERDFAI